MGSRSKQGPRKKLSEAELERMYQAEITERKAWADASVAIARRVFSTTTPSSAMVFGVAERFYQTDDEGEDMLGDEGRREAEAALVLAHVAATRIFGEPSTESTFDVFDRVHGELEPDEYPEALAAIETSMAWSRQSLGDGTTPEAAFEYHDFVWGGPEDDEEDDDEADD